jgi:acyl-CoA thioesterase-2
VAAIQHGEQIFNLAASFQTPEEGLEHQADMPDAPDPDSLPTEVEYLRSLGEDVHPRFLKIAEYPRPVDLRWVDPQHPTKPVPKSSTKQVWMRARAPIGDDVRLQQCALAYASDMAFMESALRPHGLIWTTPGLQAASLARPRPGARPDVHPRRQAGGFGGAGMPDAGAEVARIGPTL